MSLLKHKMHCEEEQEVASIIAGMNFTSKRMRSDEPNDDISNERLAKRVAVISEDEDTIVGTNKCEVGKDSSEWALKPAPYFYYTDRSLEEDDDPTAPVTAFGRVPNFPAKMHAILSDPSLANIVSWAPHGRAWFILHPRNFEAYVLPKYFDHAKFSSFVRQANGWGFRRLSQGHDRNAYYHEYFLQGMPHLCKKMKRPKVSEKKSVPPEYEPDLYAISRECPIPAAILGKDCNVVVAPMTSQPDSVPSKPFVYKDPTLPKKCPSVPVTPPVVSDVILQESQQIINAMSSNPHFAAGFLAASTAHATTVQQVAAYFQEEFARRNGKLNPFENFQV